MELNDKVTQLEDEIKILKNEVQAVLLDLRESYLNNENPFNPNQPNPNQPSFTGQPIIINQPPLITTEKSPAAREEPDDLPIDREQKNELPPENREGELTGEDGDGGIEEEEAIPEVEPEEPSGETQPINVSGLIASEKAAREEVKRAWQPETGAVAHFKPKESTDVKHEKLELATISSLAQWVDEAVQRLGHKRTRSILDISETLGYVNTDLKNILVKFISPVQEEEVSRITTQDYLASLIELNSLMGRDSKTEEIALLYILCQENHDR